MKIKKNYCLALSPFIQVSSSHTREERFASINQMSGEAWTSRRVRSRSYQNSAQVGKDLRSARTEFRWETLPCNVRSAWSRKHSSRDVGGKVHWMSRRNQSVITDRLFQAPARCNREGFPWESRRWRLSSRIRAEEDLRSLELGLFSSTNRCRRVVCRDKSPRIVRGGVIRNFPGSRIVFVRIATRDRITDASFFVLLIRWS